MIHLQVEMQDLTEIESALGMMRDRSKYVLRAAVNDTARQTVKLLVDGAGKKYYMSKSNVRKSMSISKATVRTLTAIVASEGTCE